MTPESPLPINEHSRLRPSSGVYARPFGEELVLLEFGRGEYFALDAIGTRIWRSLEAGRDLGEAAADVASAYEVGVGEALTDIVALVSKLHGHALVDMI